MESINIVTKIERTRCDNIEGVVLTTANKIRLASSIEWENMCISKTAKLTINSKKDAKNTIHEHKLVFRSIKSDCDEDRYAYRISVAGGKQYLIGDDKRPFPVPSVAILVSSSATDDTLSETTVTWNSTHKAYLIYNI